MTRLTMHGTWFRGPTEDQHLDLAWEAARSRVMPGYLRRQSQPGARHK